MSASILSMVARRDWDRAAVTVAEDDHYEVSTFQYLCFSACSIRPCT
jgi:hypothetical protein